MKIQVNANTEKVEAALTDYAKKYRNEDFSVDLVGDKKEGTFIFLHSDEDEEEVLNALSDNGIFGNVIKESYNMKHIKTYEQLNEGWFNWLFKKLYRVNYTTEVIDPKTKEANSYKSYIVVKADDEDKAEEAFYEKWEKAVKRMDPEPKLILGNIKKTDRADKKNIEFPKALKSKD